MADGKERKNAHEHEDRIEESGATSGQTHQDVLEKTVGRERAARATRRRASGDAE